MTRPADETEAARVQRPATYLDRIFDALAWLDDLIVAAGCAFGRAMVDGLAAYGMAHGGSVADTHPYESVEGSEHAGEFIEDDFGDDFGLDEFDDIHALIQSIKDQSIKGGRPPKPYRLRLNLPGDEIARWDDPERRPAQQ